MSQWVKFMCNQLSARHQSKSQRLGASLWHEIFFQRKVSARYKCFTDQLWRGYIPTGDFDFGVKSRRLHEVSPTSKDRGNTSARVIFSVEGLPEYFMSHRSVHKWTPQPNNQHSACGLGKVFRSCWLTVNISHRREICLSVWSLGESTLSHWPPIKGVSFGERLSFAGRSRWMHLVTPTRKKGEPKES